MVRTLHKQEDNRKTVQQCSRKVHPILKNVSNDVKLSKENKDHLQQKMPSQLQIKKVQPKTNSLRQTFVIYSKIHFICLNKFHTLFLAFHLYEFAFAEPALKNISLSYRALCCMYIAMKYEEIYPIELKELARYMRISYNSKEYAQYELMILKAIGMNLDVLTVDRMLQAYFQQYKLDMVEEIQCYYLLELAFVSPKIYKKFNEGDICSAIIKLVKNIKDFENESTNIKSLIRLMLQSKMNSKGLQRHINHQFQSKRYDFVAYLPIPLP